MKNPFEYRWGDGILYRLDPLLKTVFLVFFWVLTLYANLPSLFLLLALVFAAAFYSGLAGGLLGRTRFFILYVFPFIVFFQLFFHQSFSGGNPSLFFLNPSVSVEGVVMGLQVGSRLFCLFSSSILFIMSTNPLHLLRRLSGISFLGFRIPGSVTFFFVFVNRSMALVFNDLERILDAQRARGFSIREAGLRQKITGYPALLIPLLTLSIERAQKQAVALELRGFGFKKGGGDMKPDP